MNLTDKLQSLLIFKSEKEIIKLSSYLKKIRKTMYEIEQIKLTEAGKKFIYDHIIAYYSEIPQKLAESANGIKFEFPLDPEIEVDVNLDLNVDYSIPDGNNQSHATEVSAYLDVKLFHGSEPVKGLENWNIEDMVQSYDWIQYF